ncbi:MAG TPA: hypothetical protein VJ820_19375 [Propionibacteriaceae bacterium]|nr:hypothetical protein [Propionibacteriaceae bacterium]
MGTGHLLGEIVAVAPQTADAGRDGKTVELRPIFTHYLAGQLPVGEILVPRNGSVAAGRGMMAVTRRDADGQVA